jgi:RNase P subunit RPR2
MFALLQKLFRVRAKRSLRVLHCPKCHKSQKVDFETLPFRFVNRRQTGSMNEVRCPKCGFFIPGRNALNASSMRDAIERQKKFEELIQDETTDMA